MWVRVNPKQWERVARAAGAGGGVGVGGGGGYLGAQERCAAGDCARAILVRGGVSRG